MNLRTVRSIAAKEFKDVVRDRRTLFFMMLLPVAVMPLLFIGVAKFVMQQSEAKRERVLTIAIDEAGLTTLKALQKNWHFTHDKAVFALLAKQGLEAAGNIDGLIATVLGESSGADAEDASAEQARGLQAAMEAATNLTPRERQLLEDFRAIDPFLQKSEFVLLRDLTGDGELAQGVEVPPDTPPLLAEPRVAGAVQEKSIAAALWLPADTLTTLAEAERSGPVHVLYDSSQPLSQEAYDRLAVFLAAINRQMLDERLLEHDLPTDFTVPLERKAANVATTSRKLQAFLGGIIPYLLFAFCFFGAMYPALDVTAGEKERFTLETLLLAPVSRLEIATGKFVVVLVAAIIAAVLSTASMVITATKGILPASAASAFDLEFQPLALVLTASLMLPVAALYSSLLLAVGLYARSFKEAQSYTVPLQFILLLPMLVSFVPDVEAEPHLAWIPFVNIAMLMRELLKGNYLWSFYAITLASTLILTVLGLLTCAWLFRRESVLLRS